MKPFKAFMAGGRTGGSSGGTTSITWNSADKYVNISLSELDKRMTRINGSQWGAARATVSHDASSVGGFYYEAVSVGDGGNNDGLMIGIGTSSAALVAGSFPGSDANGRSYCSDGTKYASGGFTSYAGTYSPGDNVGVLLKNGKLYFRKNGVWQNSADPVAETGAAFTGLTGFWFPMGGAFYTDVSSIRAINRVYSLPSGAADWIP